MESTSTVFFLITMTRYFHSVIFILSFYITLSFLFIRIHGQIPLSVTSGGLIDVCVKNRREIWGCSSDGYVWERVGTTWAYDGSWVNNSVVMDCMGIACGRGEEVFLLTNGDEIWGYNVLMFEDRYSAPDMGGYLENIDYDLFLFGATRNYDSWKLSDSASKTWEELGIGEIHLSTVVVSGGNQEAFTLLLSGEIRYWDGFTFVPFTTSSSIHIKMISSTKPNDQIFLYGVSMQNKLYVLRYPQSTEWKEITLSDRPYIIRKITVAYDGTLLLLGDTAFHSNYFVYFGDLHLHTCSSTPSISSSVCSGRGACIYAEACVCDSNYYGDVCDVTICHEIFSNETEIVCSGKGYCKNSLCDCFDDYFGEQCDITLCQGVLTNSSDNICGNHGNCFAKDTCVCSPGYFSYYHESIGLANQPTPCNITTCNGTFSNLTSSVCSGRGVCVEENRCDCEEGVYGKLCDTFQCLGKFSNDSSVCSYVGNCSDVSGNCYCEYGYFGEECEVTFCEFEGTIHFSNESSVCSGRNGSCDRLNNCTCFEGYYGDNCEYFYCNGVGVSSSDGLICSGHGICVDHDVCVCKNASYNVSDFCDWKCFGVDRRETEDVCGGGHGTCVDFENCECQSSYYGGNCEFWKCFNVSVTEKDLVCGGHGLCTKVNFCYCDIGYRSTIPDGECNQWHCNGIYKTKSDVCSGRGRCEAWDTCKCFDNYEGDDCQTFSCFNILREDKSVCSNGNGKCKSIDKCECKFGFYGTECESGFIVYVVLGPVISLIAGGLGLGLITFCLLLACGIGCCLLLCLILCSCFSGIIFRLSRRMRKFSKLKNVDILIHEQELENDTSIAHIKINKALFEIEMSEIKILDIIGEGGSSSVVYRASWKSTIIAFKCFRTRLLCSSQDSFDEFEREVEVMASISHPGIIRFYGCSMEPPRLGILMEFCEKGDLVHFLSRHETDNDKYPIRERLRMIHEIIMSIDYLHGRSIIHRDLKLENVLVDSSENTKLMDFGLSRLVDSMSDNLTKNIGTDIYMAPEIVTAQSQYNEKCDVFSFAVMIFVIATLNFHPYDSVIDTASCRIELKVSQDPMFRPKIEELSTLPSKKMRVWLGDLIEKCWSHEPSKRPSFQELNEEFVCKMEEFDKLFMDVEDENQKYDDDSSRRANKEDEEGKNVQILMEDDDSKSSLMERKMALEIKNLKMIIHNKDLEIQRLNKLVLLQD